MLLNNGTHDGQRILSENAVRALGAKQTPPAIPNTYGLGFETHPWGYSHGGAHGTHMAISPQHGIITVYLIQHAGYTNDTKGNGACGVFNELTVQQYGKQK